METHINNVVKDDFNKARKKASLSNLINILTPEKKSLLSFSTVEKLLKPKGQRYKGLHVVSINQIVGSEGRYNDFNKAFLPKHDALRRRWENVDKAHHTDIILPPIKLYEVGGVYFVRDGNHRVSVAKMQGIESIDAEVISLDSEIQIAPSMTEEELKKAVIDYEKAQFYKKYPKLKKIINPDELNFTATGRYNEIIIHINGHKYYLNLDKNYEISFEDAASSWYQNLFKPIVDTISIDNILSRFPGRTNGDLYVWIIRHWDDLKKKHGEYVSIGDAAKHYSEKYGKSLLQQIKDYFKKLLNKN